MRDDVLIHKMYGYTTKILRYCKNHTYESFSSDSMLVEACVFNLSQLGELCHLADKDLIARHPEIEWHDIYGLRNRIVHDYDGVNLRLVWEIINDDLPDLERKLFTIMSSPE